MIMHRDHMDLSVDGPLAQSMFICFYSLKSLAGPIKMWLRAIHSCGVFYSVVVLQSMLSVEQRSLSGLWWLLVMSVMPDCMQSIVSMT